MGAVCVVRSARWTRSPHVVELLLEQMRGRGLEGRDNMVKTAPHHACEAENLETARLMLYCGADHTAADGQGRTPMMATALLRHPGAMISLLTVSG